MSRADSSSMTLEVLSSEELACRAQAGSLPSYAQLVERHQAKLYNFLLRRIGHECDAEDIVQDTFVRAWERIHQYQPKWRFSTWLYTIGSRLAINHHRAGARRQEKHRSDLGLERMPGNEADPSEVLAQREERDNVWDLAARLLTPDQQTLLWLRYAEELSSREIATVLGKTQVAVRVSLHRAKHRIAQAIETQQSESSSQAMAKQSTTSVTGHPVPGGVS
ncbi:MAG: RNA polymerase sigma factor [Planctomycetota bacterium]|nr:RNA polymerase sigma factor [Planctomycetota bacterium]